MPRINEQGLTGLRLGDRCAPRTSNLRRNYRKLCLERIANRLFLWTVTRTADAMR